MHSREGFVYPCLARQVILAWQGISECQPALHGKASNPCMTSAKERVWSPGHRCYLSQYFSNQCPPSSGKERTDTSSLQKCEGWGWINLMIAGGDRGWGNGGVTGRDPKWSSSVHTFGDKNKKKQTFKNSSVHTFGDMNKIAVQRHVSAMVTYGALIQSPHCRLSQTKN